MASKMVSDRERSAKKVTQAAETHATKIDQKLRPALAAALGPDEPAPDVGALIRALGRVIRSSAAELDAADRAHEAELADDAAPRAARAEAAAEVSAELVELRSTASVVFGEAVVAELGFDGPTPQDPTPLAKLAATVLANLPKLQDRAPQSRALRFDPTVFRATLPPAIAKLNAALDDVTREAREAEATLVAKQRALTAHDERFGAAASAITALFSLAGEPELAARVRPSTTRPGRTHADASGADAAAPEPPAAP